MLRHVRSYSRILPGISPQINHYIALYFDCLQNLAKQMERKRKTVLPFCCTQALIPQPFSLAFYSLNMVYILRLRNCNFRLHMTLWRVHSGVTPEQLGQSDPHMPSSGEADQTAQQLLLSWPHRPAPHAHHATCCRGSWTTQTKVILHMLVHMFALLYLMHTLTHNSQDTSANCRSDECTWEQYECPF